jgi:glycosyltransferase involved in cell wall biosynthesis
MQTKLSIIICVHNGEHYIAECIESLCLADYPQWEAIVINDASTDATLDIVESFAQKHANLRCHSLTHNLGPGDARNFGIMLAKGEHIAFLDADDYIDAAVLAEKLRGIDAETDVLISGHFRLYDHGLSAIAIEAGEFSGHAAACLYLRRKFGTWASWIHICRRDHLLRNNCFFASRVYSSDVTFCFKTLYTAAKIIADPTPFYIYRNNNDSITRGDTITPLHLMSLARLHFDLVQITQSKPESEQLRVAFERAINILISDDLPRMENALQKGMHTISLEFFKEFIYYIKYCDTLFSRGVLSVIKSQPCGKKLFNGNDMEFRYSRFWRITNPLRSTAVKISQVLTYIKNKALSRQGENSN